MAKRSPLEGYKTYNPEVDGYGSKEDWKDSFRKRTGLGEAKDTLGSDDPLTFLGLKLGATWAQIKSAFRRMALKWHPDMNPSPEAKSMMQKINAAYTVLEHQYHQI